MSDALLRMEELISNPYTRVPVCLCLDVSGSMSGQPIQELNEGVRLFYDAIKEDQTAFYAAEISIVVFGGRKAECIRSFSGLKLQPDPPELQAGGMTPMGEAVNMALDLLEQKKREYQSNGVDYFQPWLVLMTDGSPNGDKEEQARAISRTTEAVNNRKLTIFPIGIGSKADMKVLHEFSPKRVPVKLKDLKFREFFTWLSKSVSTTSRSTLGDSIKLDTEGLTEWVDIGDIIE